MNIIEAIQQAENGKLIAGGIIKKIGCFLKYIKRGVFYQYELHPDGTTTYKYEVRDFTMGEILSNDWEVVDVKINPKKQG